MGDIRFRASYERIRDAENRIVALRSLSDEDVVEALAGASEGGDTLVANFLATEANNRVRRARRTLDHIWEGVVATDRSGLVTLLNPAAERILGWLSEDAQGRDITDILRASPGVMRREDAAGIPPVPVIETAKKGTRHFDEAWIEGRWPHAIHASVTVAPVWWEDDFVGAVLTIHDLSRGEAPP